jgi:type I restriction enzyme M protein
MTQKQLEDYLWGAANILRGMIDAADFKQYIFPLLFFKRVSDLWDEEYQTALDESGGDLTFAEFAENHRFQIPEECHWDDVRKRTIDVGAFLQKALNGIEKANFEMLHDVFGDAQWTNKRRMSDEKMLDLIEHFSKMKLTIAEVPHDIMGDGYEYLIKKFADDSGHTAAEFYTNRTLVKLMTLITDPKPGESVYDPTCGSGGILLNSVLYLKEQKKEYRTLKLYGQELNLITSAIARMNMFMHNIDEFLVVQGDTLDSPQILENDELKKFDVIMANPPYSIKRWSQAKWTNDPYGRNIWGTPPQGCADYAFQQHIMKSLKAETGRSVVLWPHGVLYRDAELEMRKKMIELDLVDAVIGLGPNLFYNSTMESCLLICKMQKDKKRKNKILFIDASAEVARVTAYSFLSNDHIEKIFKAYKAFEDKEGFAKVVSNDDVLKKQNGNLTISRYVKKDKAKKFDIDIELSNFEAKSKEIGVKLDEYNQHLFSDIVLLKFREIVTNKENWKPFKFKELVNNLNKSETKPLENGIEKFVGLEHISSDTFQIQGYGLIKNGTSFTKRFFQGNVLFSKRRSYLKKVAVADFEGICSGDILVFEVKKEKVGILLDSYLPFIVRSNEFINFATYTSAGSLSPRTKWKEIADYKLLLPSIEEQKKIVEALNQFAVLTKALKENITGFDEKLNHLHTSIMNDAIV